MDTRLASFPGHSLCGKAWVQGSHATFPSVWEGVGSYPNPRPHSKVSCCRLIHYLSVNTECSEVRSYQIILAEWVAANSSCLLRGVG